MSDLVKKNVDYLNKDFSQFRQNLINFVKTYFPNEYNDFNESSPGMMFIEMASYVGDVLGFYMDEQMKENFLSEAQERKNVYTLARSFGYKPKNTIASNVDLDVFQLVPSIGSGDNVRPDYNYALRIESNMLVSSKTDSSVEFRTIAPVDFAYSSSYSPTDVFVHETDGGTNEPTYYLLKKSVKAVSGKINTKTFTFSDPRPYDKITIEDDNIIEIIDIIDSDGNIWYEVPYLAQDTIFESVENTAKNDSSLSVYRDESPYLLNIKKIARRFVANVTSRNFIEIQFGAGISSEDDEDIIPNPDLIGSKLLDVEKTFNTNIDPTNFLLTKTYGIAPSNTTLTVRYAVGGGVQDNIPSNDLINITSKTLSIEERSLDKTLLNQIKASVRCINPKSGGGGKSEETIDEIKNNTLASFSAQNRVVTKEDYLIRSYSLPKKFGAVAKAYVIRDDQLNQNRFDGTETRNTNPYAINLYTLGYDNNKNLTPLNDAVKQNLTRYIDYYRILTDSVNIKNANIINIGIEFEIVARPSYNSNEVLVRCIDMLKKHFEIDKWQINQPIARNDLYVMLDKVEGVQTVSNVQIINLWNSEDGYSGNIYDIETATRDGIVYPSLDPSIFEVKYPNKDIRGRIKTFGG